MSFTTIEYVILLLDLLYIDLAPKLPNHKTTLRWQRLRKKRAMFLFLWIIML